MSAFQNRDREGAATTPAKAPPAAGARIPSRTLPRATCLPLAKWSVLGGVGRLKWDLLIIVVLLLLAWLVSLSWIADVNISPRCALVLADGQIGLWDFVAPRRGGHVERSRPETYGLTGLNHYDWTGLGNEPVIVVPLWLLLAPLVCLTAFLFYRDHGYPPGCCPKCGYDLTGNVSGTCPECGKAHPASNQVLMPEARP